MKATWAIIALTLAGSATTSLFAGDLSISEGSTELVSKVYDLSHLRMQETEIESETVVLFPTSFSRSRLRNSEWNSLTDSFIGLVENVLWEEIEYDGRSMDASGEEHLYLKAPAGTHTELKELLSFYEGLCTAETRMHLFWVQVPKGVQAPSGLISEDKVIDWMDTLPGGAISSDTFDVPAYRAGVSEQTHRTPILAEVDVEIAQGAVTLDGAMRMVGSGRWAMVHAIPAEGGVQMSMTWAAVAAPELTNTPLQIVAMLGAEGKPAGPVHQGGAVQLMHQSANVASTRVFVPTGMASISKVVTSGNLSTYLVAIPSQVPSLERSYELSGPRKDRGVAFLRRSLVPLKTRWNLLDGFGSDRESSDQWCWRNQYDSSEWITERALEGIADNLVSYKHVGGYVLLHTAHGVDRDQLQIAHLELDRAAKRLRSLISKGASYKVTLAGWVGDKEQVFEIEQVVAQGSQSTWFCGAERSFIHDFNTEVAQYAAVHDPEVVTNMEGSLIELSLMPSIDNGLQVQIDARLNLPQGLVSIDSASPMHANTKRMTYQTTRINTLRKLTPADNQRAWSANFGGYADGAIYLTLKVEPVE